VRLTSESVSGAKILSLNGRWNQLMEWKIWQINWPIIHWRNDDGLLHRKYYAGTQQQQGYQQHYPPEAQTVSNQAFQPQQHTQKGPLNQPPGFNPQTRPANNEPREREQTNTRRRPNPFAPQELRSASSLL